MDRIRRIAGAFEDVLLSMAGPGSDGARVVVDEEVSKVEDAQGRRCRFVGSFLFVRRRHARFACHLPDGRLSSGVFPCRSELLSGNSPWTSTTAWICMWMPLLGMTVERLEGGIPLCRRDIAWSRSSAQSRSTSVRRKEGRSSLLAETILTEHTQVLEGPGTADLWNA